MAIGYETFWIVYLPNHRVFVLHYALSNRCFQMSALRSTTTALSSITAL